MSKRLKVQFTTTAEAKLPLDVWRFVVVAFCPCDTLAALAQTSTWWRNVVAHVLQKRAAPAVSVMREVMSTFYTTANVHRRLNIEVITAICCSVWLGASSTWLDFGPGRAGRTESMIVFAAAACRAGVPLDVTIGVNGPAEIPVLMNNLRGMIATGIAARDASIVAPPTFDVLTVGTLRARFVAVTDKSVQLDNSVLLLSGAMVDDHRFYQEHSCINRLIEQRRGRGTVVGLCLQMSERLKQHLHRAPIADAKNFAWQTQYRLLQHLLAS